MTDEMPEHLEADKSRLLDSIDSRHEGLDIEQVNYFLGSYGLKPRESVIFYDEDIDQLKEVLPEDRSFQTFLDDARGRRCGAYFPRYQTSLLRRPREYEATNGPVVTEGFLVHELSHSTSELASYKITDLGDEIGISVPRCGQNVSGEGKSWGNFFEEGFAEMMRAEYVKTFQGEAERVKLLTRLGKPSESTLDASIPSSYRDLTYYIPLKYAYITPDNNNVQISVTTMAGMGLELICKKEPRLWNALISARKEMSGLREVPKIINGLKSGLYTDLRALGYSREDFSDGYKKIVDSLFDGKLSLNDQGDINI